MSDESENISKADEAEVNDPSATDGDSTGDSPQSDGDGPTPIEALTEERDKLRDQLLRMTADFDNYRRRSRREVEEAKMRGKDDTVRDFLPIFDNLERAVTASEGVADVQSVVEGVRMVLKLFEDTAQRMGLNRVPGLGERFDPAMHEAIQQIETDEHPAGAIIAEVAPGYMFGQRLLRAAMVVVARPKKTAPSPAVDDDATETSSAAQSPSEAEDSSSDPS